MKNVCRFWPLLPVFAFYLHNIDLSSDSYLLVQGAQLFWSHLKTESFPIGDSFGPFASLQYLAALPLALLGLKQGLIVRILIFLNMAASAFLARTVYKHFKKIEARSVGRFFLLIFLSGMPLWYAHAPLSEALATVCISVLILEFLEKRRPLRLLLWAFLSACSKETAIPFLILYLLAAFTAQNDPRIKTRANPTACFSIFSGFALGALSQVALNEIRYGTFWNLNYMQKLFQVQELTTWVSFFFTQFFSPTVGLIFVWPSFVLTFILITRISIQSRTTRLSCGIISLSLFGLIAGFARWYTPVGSVSWGPRLLFPWLIPALIILLHSSAAEIQKQISLWQTTLTQKTKFLVCAALGLLSLPAYSALFGAHLLGYPFEGDAVCTKAPVIQTDVANFYHCMNHIFWGKEGILLRVFHVTENPGAFAAALVCIFILIRELKLFLAAPDN